VYGVGTYCWSCWKYNKSCIGHSDGSYGVRFEDLHILRNTLIGTFFDETMT